MANIRKALVPLFAAALAIGTQLLKTGHFTLDTEGVTAIFGVVAAVAVYLVPNLMSAGLAGVRKALIAVATAGAAVVVQWVATKHFGTTQELVTAITGLVTALFVYWVPNAGQTHPETRPI